MDYVKVPAGSVLTDDQIGSVAPLKHCLLLSRYSGNKFQVAGIDSDRLVDRLGGS